MDKLYPPNIGGTIPAFYKNSQNKLTVPFTMNKTVSANEIRGFNLIIKTVANSKHIGTLTVELPEQGLPDWNLDKGEVYFTIPEGDNLWKYLHEGQYYKLQLAYIKISGIIGYYSSVGIIKFTTKPEVIIEGLDLAKINVNNNVYMGFYSQQGKDSTEKVYSYRFDVYDESNNLYDTSGDQIHNSFEDENAYSSRDIFNLTKDLITNKNYYIQYTVSTNNNAIFKSSKYRIMQKETIDPEIRAELVANLDYSNGYIDVKLIGEKDNYGIEYAATGSFVLTRGCNKDNFSIWNPILTFKLNGQQPSRWLWKDFTVEHGYIYKYALQQYNDTGLYSNKLYSNDIYVSFEDCFLYDGKKQLKLKYNPKITSFKNNVLESRTNTIGSQYPFIFRNGSVYYKEFPISGLISYFMDDEELFIKKEELFLEDKTINLTDNNIAAERIFKMKVLEFFNDGKPKIFRSPAEGNFIVRLMNVSMSANDTVGRMLHTISTTACEVSNFSYESLIKYDIIKLVNSDSFYTRWETVQMIDVNEETGKNRIRNKGEPLLNYSPAITLEFENIIPGTQFVLENEDGEKNIITIGTTGSYKLNIGMKIKEVYINSSNINQGSLIYSYQSNISNVFDTYKDIEINDYPLVQFIGKHDIVNEIEDIRTEIIQFNYLRFNKRQVYNVYTDNTKISESGQIIYYWDQSLNGQINLEDYEEAYIYKATNLTNGNEYYFDGSPLNIIESYSNCFYIDGNQVDLTETEVYELIRPDKITSLIMDSGLTLECSYQTKIKIYTLETSNSTIKKAYEDYINAYNAYFEMLIWDKEDGVYYDGNSYTSAYFTKLKQLENNLYSTEKEKYLYDIFIDELVKAIEELEKELYFNE